MRQITSIDALETPPKIGDCSLVLEVSPQLEKQHLDHQFMLQTGLWEVRTPPLGPLLPPKAKVPTSGKNKQTEERKRPLLRSLK